MKINILFIEDDDEKRSKILDYLKGVYKYLNITNKASYHSGLTELVSGNEYNLVLMDMSMPNYDITLEEPDEENHESYAGRQLLEQMKFRYINYPTIIITQFASFGEYVEKLSLDELKENLKKDYFPIYRSTVYYHSSESDWKEKLKNEIDSILEEKEC